MTTKKAASPKSKRIARLEHTEPEWKEEGRVPSRMQPELSAPDHVSPSQPGRTPEELDEELVLTYLTYYHALEQAMMRAGFTRAGRTPGTSQADWARFARHIEGQFDPDSSPVLQGAVSYLLWEDQNLASRNQRLEDMHPWDNAGAFSDIVWISELLQRTCNKLTYDLNLPGAQACETAQVMASLMIVEEWGRLDPTVGQYLNSHEAQ